MHVSKFVAALVSFLMIGALMLAAADLKAPTKALIFKGKPKDVAFDHTSHVKAAGGKCDTCHPKLFPQKFDQTALKFKGGAMHKAALDAKTSCAACHHANSEVKGAFDVKGNCMKCHTVAAS
jgi:c(7)-type cytochrome triheme protein